MIPASPGRGSILAFLALLPACNEARARPAEELGPVTVIAIATAPIGLSTSDSSAPITPVPASGCPEGMARTGMFCIDRYEAHLVTRGPAGEITPHPYFNRPEPGIRYEARSEPGVFPQAYVSRVESAAACGNAGKRLCSLSEWRRACQGPRATTYPYGNRAQPGHCNADKQHLLTLRFGADTMRWRYEQFNDPTLDQAPGFLARTGDYNECAGEDGVHDMVGNLHEWVGDSVDYALMGKLDGEMKRAYQPWRPGNGVFAGGFFSTHGELGPGCKFTTVAHEPGYHDYSTGFRCCAAIAP